MEDIELLNKFKKFSFNSINHLLTTDAELDISYMIEAMENEDIDIESLGLDFSKLTTEDNIDLIKQVYGIMLKQYFSQRVRNNWSFITVLTIDEINKIKNEMYIDKFLMVTKDRKKVEKKYAEEISVPVILNVFGSKDLPYLDIKGVIENQPDQTEVLISPFSKVSSLEKANDITLNSGKNAKVYNIYLDKQEFTSLSDEEASDLYRYIVENADSVNLKMKKCLSVEKENEQNYSEIRKLEYTVSDMESTVVHDENTPKSILSDEEKELQELKKQLDSLKEETSRLFEKRKRDSEFISKWKRTVVVYLMAECKKIDDSFVIQEQIKDEIAENKVKEIEENIKEEEIKKVKKDHEELVDSVIKECEENCQSAKDMINKINALIARQQNNAKIAGELGTSYSALNNGFEMKKKATLLEENLNKILDRVHEIIENEKHAVVEKKLKKISIVNNQISVLINYLNNPKSQIGIAKVSRFDEMNIVEENTLKRGIAKEILSIRGEAELKKLKDDVDIIESKTGIIKFLGVITGRNKMDEILLDQIEIRERAIHKKLSQTMSLAENYSIHEMLADIKMFLVENKDDELVERDCRKLEIIQRKLEENFVIESAKIDQIIDEKENTKLPMKLEKVSKKEMLEIETYKFLKKYGYDFITKTEDVKYNDTMANEINAVVEYIKSSNVFEI